MRTVITVVLTGAMIGCWFAAFRQRTWPRILIYGAIALASLAVLVVYGRALVE